jgi:hypothetical protein
VSSEAKKVGDNITTDTHKYYSSSFVPYERTWVDLDELNATGRAVVQVSFFGQTFRKKTFRKNCSPYNG